MAGRVNGGSRSLAMSSSVAVAVDFDLRQSVAALDIGLADDEIRALEEHYTPHGRSWFLRS